MIDWKEIAQLLADRIACGCSQPDPCWTCQQALKRFHAKRNEDSRIHDSRIKDIHRHAPDQPER